MIKAIIFDLDNTLLDFMKMKSKSINSAIDGMISIGMQIDKKDSIKEMICIIDLQFFDFVNFYVFIMVCVYVVFFGLMVLITPSSISDCSAWYVWLAYINLNQCSNSVTASYIQICDSNAGGI